MKLAELAEDGEHKLQGHIDFQGLHIAVENRKGSVRSGTSPNGKKWRTVMKAPYGYIEGTTGKDNDSVDAYVGPHRKEPYAYVVHQHKPDGTGFDEDKVILGVRSVEEARKLYLAHYDSPKFLGPIDKVPVAQLVAIAKAGKKTPKIEGEKQAMYSSMSSSILKMAASDSKVGYGVCLPGGNGQKAPKGSGDVASDDDVVGIEVRNGQDTLYNTTAPLQYNLMSSR